MKETKSPHEPTVDLRSRRLTLVTHLVLNLGYVICAVIFQILSSVRPSSEAAPLEFFTRSLLWMLSLICLLIANRSRSWKLLFWLMACVALAVLAIDERFEFHEQTGRRGWFDDDYFKIVSWAAAAVVLFVIFRMERPARFALGALILGYAFHTLYLLTELGDGEFFRLPAPKRTIRWVEEICELLFLASYLVGFVLIQMGFKSDLQRE